MTDFDAIRRANGLLPEQPSLSETIKSTPDWSPDEHAKDLNLGREMGLPPAVVKENRPQAEIDVQFNRVPERAIRTDTPALFDKIRNDPDFAIVARDDIENLYSAAKATTGLGTAIVEGVASNVETGKIAIGGTLQRAGSVVPPEFDPEEFGEPEGVWDAAMMASKATAKILTGALDVAKEKVFGAEALAEVKATGVAMSEEGRRDMQARMQNLHFEDLSAKKAVFTFLSSAAPLVVSAVTAAVTRNPGLGASVMGGYVYGSAYDEGVNVMGLSPEQAGNRAVYHAAAEGIPEMIPLGFAVAGGKLALKSIIKRYAGAVLSEAGQEMITEVLQTGIDAGLYGEDITLKQAIINTLEAGMAGAFGGGAIASVGTGATAVNSIQHSRIQNKLDAALQADNSKMALEDLAEKVRKTKMFGRDKEMVAKFIEGASNVKAVHVDSAGIDETYTRLGQEAGDAMIQQLGIADQVKQAQKTGGDYVIPLSNIMKAIDSEFFPDVADHMRMTPDAMTAKEAKKVQENIKEIEAEAETLMAAAAVGDKNVNEAIAIGSEVEQQLIKTGMKPADAKASSLLHRNFALVTAARSGLTPRQVMGGLSVKRAQFTVADEILDDAATRFSEDPTALGTFLEGSQAQEPLYHGTMADITEFKNLSGNIGIHVGTRAAAGERLSNTRMPTDNETATRLEEDFSKGDRLPLGAEEEGGHNILPVYVSIKNPLRVKDTGFYDPKVFMDFLPEELKAKAMERWPSNVSKKGDQYEFSGFDRNGDVGIDIDEIRQWLEYDLGYDGIVYQNEVEDAGQDSYVVFNPEQIKSAVGNRGTYDPNDPNILHQEEVKDGRAFRDFFSSVVTGAAGTSNTGVPYRPVIQREDLNDFSTEYVNHRGNFDDHIAFSIPGYKEVQMAVGNAISKVAGPEAVMLDIGASEGSIGKTITALGGPKTVSLDPNPDMASAFASHSTVDGASYAMAAFSPAEQAGQVLWQEGETDIRGFKPETKFDVIHEAMTFQFIDNNRAAHLDRIVEMLADGGLVVMEEKFHNANWDANEKAKNKHKSQYFDKKDMDAKATAVLEGMNENMVQDKEFEKLLAERFDYVAQFWDAGNFKGYVATNDPVKLSEFLGEVGDTSSEFATVQTPRAPRVTFGQSASLRRGKESLAKYGLSGKQRYTTREVAMALEARQVSKYGYIGPKDRSTKAEANIAKWMAQEIKFEMEHPEDSGVGWYSEKFQRAIDIMGSVYPELLTDQKARDMFTALIAITSDGQKVQSNYMFASELYADYRVNKRFNPALARGNSAKSIRGNLEQLNKLIDQFGTGGELHDYLLTEMSVKDLRQWARDNNVSEEDFKVSYEGHIMLPFSAGVFGPKLGAFYANLMGAHGYLTMDRWWMRTINRYRGNLIDAPTEVGLSRFRELLGDAGLDVIEYSNEDLVFATIPFQRSYEEKGFKNGTDIERAANTIHKAAFVALRDSPDNASDRSFMLRAAARAQKNLKRSGVDMTIADIQAALWYYEKRLYGELGARASADISYEEAATRAVNGTLEATGINIEVAPDPKDLELAHSFDQLTPAAKLEATHDVAENVVRKLATQMGIPEVDIQYANGGYLDLVNPSLVITSQGASFEDLTDLGLVLGEIFSQESILVYDEAATKSSLRGKRKGTDLTEHVRIAPARALSNAEQADLYQHLRTKVEGLDGFTWRDGAMVFADVAGIGASFQDRIVEAINSWPTDVRVSVTRKAFKSQLLEIEHGDSIQGGVTKGTEILRRRSGDSGASTDAYARQAAETLRGHLNQSYGQSERRAPAASDQSLTLDPGGQLRTDRDGMVPLTHWGKVKGLTSIDPAFQGTGARGAEAARDDRTPRSYWGLPGYRSEIGPLSLANGRAFTRVAPEALYDFARDPEGYRAKARAEIGAPGSAEEVTAYENLIKSAGYLGYWANMPGHGPVAAVFHTITISETHPVRTKHRDRGAFVAGYDAAGNGYGDSITFGQTVYHGTGNNNPYEKLSYDKVGAEGGEGAQVQGHGIYVADLNQVAEFYRIQNEESPGSGRTYTLDMDILASEMLQWDAPFEAQPPAVQAMVGEMDLFHYEYEGTKYRTLDRLRRANPGVDVRKARRQLPANGREIYLDLAARLGSQKLASDALLAHGVPAARYLDAESRFSSTQWDVQDHALLGPDAISSDLYEAIYDMNRDNEGVPKSRRIDSPAKIREYLKAHGVAPSEIQLFEKQVNQGGITPRDKTYNYVVYDDTRLSITAFEQVLRGDITFDGESRIRLFETADLSTFLHESGHFFLERMRVISQQSPEIKKDLDAVMKWMGVNHSREIGRDQHEMFARGFEAYLRTGKAPSKDLVSAFAKFRDWLVSIYKSLVELDVTLTDEVTDVMDRMLNAGEVFENTAQEMAVDPLFQSAAEAGMTDAEYEDYIERALENRDISRAKLDTVMVEQEMKRLTAEWKVEVEKERDRIAEELANTRTYVSRGFLQTGLGIEGVEPFKLNKEEIEAVYDEEVIRNLPRGVNSIAASDGIPLDTAAELLGYESGDAMIKDQASHKELKVESLERARETVNQSKGFSPKSPVQLEFAAQDALMHRERAELLYTELRALDRMTGGKGIPRQVLKNTAKRMVSEMKNSDLKPGRYLATSIRKAKEAAKLLAQKDAQGAAKAKREQILNHLLYMQVRDARNNLDAQRRYFRKFSRAGVRKNLATDYLDQIDNLLEAYDFKQVSEKVRSKRAALSAFVAEKMAAGEEVLVPPDAIEAASRVNFKDLTVQQLRDLQDWVKNLEHMARLKSKLISAKQLRDFEAAKAAAIASMTANNEWNEQFPDYNPTFLKRVGKKLTQWHAELVNLEFICMKYDGDKRGWMWNNIWLPISQAQDTMANRKIKASADIKKLMAKHGLSAKSLKRKVAVQEVGVSMTAESRIAVVLNMGNAQGMQRLTTAGMGPDGSTWNTRQLRAIADSLDAHELEFVQDVIDMINDYWPEVYALQKELTGVPPLKVEAVPIRTKHGTLRGGYYPLKYDSDFSDATYTMDEKASVQEMFGGNFTRAMTKHGHTEQRVDKLARKVRTDLGVLDQHISEVLLDLTHRKPVMDAVKLIRDPDVAKAMKATGGLQVYRAFNPWLAYVTQSYKMMADANAWTQLAKHVRIGTSIVGLGLRVSTALINFTGIFPTLVEIRNPAILMKHASMAAKSPKKTWEFITERSDMMISRSKVFNREVAEQIRTKDLTPIWFSLIAKVDQMVTMTTWMASYEQGMKQNNNDEAKAIAYADSVVRTTQSSGREADLSAVQRNSGNELMKFLTLFYSYFNMILNQTQKSGRKLKIPGKRHEFIGDMIALWILPAIIGQLISGRGPDDDEEFLPWAAKEIALYGVASVPIARDVVNGLIGDYGYSMSPVARVGDDLIRTVHKTGKAITGEGDWLDVRKPLFSTIGYLGHLPTGQLNKTLDTIENADDLTLWNLMMGEKK